MGNQSESVWLGNEQPVGEYPSLPTVARAYKSVDQLADELRSLKTANDQLQLNVVALQGQRDDARHEVANLTDLLKKSGRHVDELSTVLAAYQDERDEWRGRAEEAEDQANEARELQVQVDELTLEVRDLKGMLGAACSARDSARAQAGGIVPL